MTTRHWQPITRSWTGILSLMLTLAAAVWLVSVYVQARYVTPRDKATVEGLKKKATRDVEVQKVLQPEFERQHQVLVARRNAYNRGSLVLLISLGVFLAWYKWFRPGPGESAGCRSGCGDWSSVPRAARKSGRRRGARN